MDFCEENSLRGAASGEENFRNALRLKERRMFMGFQGVIYMDVGGYDGTNWWLE